MKELDKLGRLVIEAIRDDSLDHLERLLDAKSGAAASKSLSNKLASLGEEARDVIRELTEDILTGAMHDLLHAFQASHDIGQGVEILVDGKSAAGLSDGLHGEIFGHEGWILRFSRHPAEAEKRRIQEAEEDFRRLFPSEDSEQS